MDKLVVCLALMLVTVYWADLNLVLSDLIGEKSGEAVRNWTPESGLNPEELGYYFEGDLKLPYGEYGSRAIVTYPKRRWPNGTIPFEISRSFSKAQEQEIVDVINQLAIDACINFVPAYGKNFTDYVYIDNEATGCWSLGAGRQGGKQIVNLQIPNCLNKGTIIHEMLHVVGLIHEHNRWDRDQYVVILKRNINGTMRQNFWRHSWREAEDHFEYDYGSIMHYSHSACSKNGLPTIIPRKPGTIIGQREGMSVFDRLEVRSIYGKIVGKCPSSGSRR